GRPAPVLPAFPHPGIRARMKSARHFRRTVPMRLSPRLRLSLLLLPLLLAACAGDGGTRVPDNAGALVAPADTTAAPVAAPADAAANASASAAADPALAAPAPSDAMQDAPGSDPTTQTAAT